MRARRTGPRPTPDLAPDQLTAAWQSASLLLGYPEDGHAEHLALVELASRTLPDEVADPLRSCVSRLRDLPLTQLQADYVATFDHRRRHNLFLTYFAHGDTRKRGVALLRFRQTFLAAGVEPVADELPDHLCLVLEFAATVDRNSGRQLLLDHRAGLELLRLSLTDAGSRWAGAVSAVCATLPPLRGDERDAVRRLAADGPPEEEVGLTPYATPAFDPGPSVPSGRTRLPMPSFPGGR